MENNLIAAALVGFQVIMGAYILSEAIFDVARGLRDVADALRGDEEEE